MCTGKVPGGKCTPSDPYYGFEGAFKCLMEAGEIAFLKHTTVQEMIDSKWFSGLSIDQFELLCKNGRRASVTDYLQCNWGMVPSNAIVTSSARTPEDTKRYQRFLKKAVDLYSSRGSFDNSTNYNDNNNRLSNNPNRFEPNRYSNRDPWNSGRSANLDNAFTTSTSVPFNDTQFYENFQLFDSRRYGRKLNLMFQDSTHNLKPLEEAGQTFKSFLGEHERIIYDIRQCPVNRMTLCVTSDAEYDKCVKMRVSLDIIS